MRYAITAIQADEEAKIAIAQDETVTVEGEDAVRDHIVAAELHEIGFDMNSADCEDEALRLQAIKREVNAIKIDFNGMKPVTVASPWAGPANEGGIDWVILPLAA